MNTTKSRGPALVGAAAALIMACQGNAQSPPHTQNATVTYTLTWHDIGNGNGLLEPGESARVRINMSFSPAVNTAIQYSPAAGGTATGTLRGFGGGAFDLQFSGAAGGSYATTGQTGGVPNGRAPDWALGPGGNGTVVGDTIANIMPAQFPFNCFDYDPVLNPQGIRTDNPVDSIYVAVWTPAAYTPRTVTAQLGLVAGQGNPASIMVQTTAGPSLPPTALTSLFNFGSVSIPVVPAPGGATALLGLLALSSCRRARRVGARP